jgi:hypothetical protein
MTEPIDLDKQKLKTLLHIIKGLVDSFFERYFDRHESEILRSRILLEALSGTYEGTVPEVVDDFFCLGIHERMPSKLEALIVENVRRTLNPVPSMRPFEMAAKDLIDSFKLTGDATLDGGFYDKFRYIVEQLGKLDPEKLGENYAFLYDLGFLMTACSSPGTTYQCISPRYSLAERVDTVRRSLEMESMISGSSKPNNTRILIDVSDEYLKICEKCPFQKSSQS